MKLYFITYGLLLLFIYDFITYGLLFINLVSLPTV